MSEGKSFDLVEFWFLRDTKAPSRSMQGVELLRITSRLGSSSPGGGSFPLDRFPYDLRADFATTEEVDHYLPVLRGGTLSSSKAPERLLGRVFHPSSPIWLDQPMLLL